MLALIGTTLAISGSAISIIGTLYNNLLRQHYRAMCIWMISNILLLAWAWGMSEGWWDGGISGKALVVMYGIFTATNLYGLWKKKQVDPIAPFGNKEW